MIEASSLKELMKLSEEGSLPDSIPNPLKQRNVLLFGQDALGVQPLYLTSRDSQINLAWSSGLISDVGRIAGSERIPFGHQ